MISLAWFIASLYITSAYATQDDQGPQYFEQITPPSADSKPGYVMKDVILYLTPTQIKALEATQGLNKVVPFGKPDQNENIKLSNEDLQKLEAELNRQLAQLRIYEKPNGGRDVIKPPAPIEEPNTEKSIPFAPQIDQEQQKVPQLNSQPEQNHFLPNQQELKEKLPESYSYIKFYTDNVAQEKTKTQVYQPPPQDSKFNEEYFEKSFEIQKDPLYQKQYKLIPYNYFEEETPEQFKQELITQVPQWSSIFDHIQSEPSLNKQLIKSQHREQNKEDLQLQKEMPEISYVAKFEEFKQAEDFQKFVAKIEKENAQVRTDAFKKSPAVVVKKEESIIKRKPIPVFKNFNTPVWKP